MLARGFALVEDADGEPVTSAAGAREAGQVALRFGDGRAQAEVEPG